jgi:hypothetical protein
MKFGKFGIIVMLVLAWPALAQLTTMVESLEASPSQIRLPTSPNGNLSFQPCAESCDAEYISVRLTPDTRFFVQGAAVKFIDFRRDFYNMRLRTDGYALVSYDTDKNTVTSVEISF